MEKCLFWRMSIAEKCKKKHILKRKRQNHEKQALACHGKCHHHYHQLHYHRCPSAGPTIINNTHNRRHARHGKMPVAKSNIFTLVVEKCLPPKATFSHSSWKITFSPPTKMPAANACRQKQHVVMPSNPPIMEKCPSWRKPIFKEKATE
jgi:hypothetical protein